jgi:hypothetical protein
MRHQFSANFATEKSGSASYHDSLSLQVHSQLPCVAIRAQLPTHRKKIGRECSHNQRVSARAIDCDDSVASTALFRKFMLHLVNTLTGCNVVPVV